MRTIYFNILIIFLFSPVLIYAQPGFAECEPTDEGNLLEVFYGGSMNTKFWKDGSSRNERSRSGEVSDCNYFNLNDTTFHVFWGSRTFFLEIKDTINISFETVQGNVDIVLVNNNILSDTLFSRFFISDLPRIPGKYIIDLHRNIEETHYDEILSFCAYNITPKNWYEHLIDSPCENNSKKLNSNGTLIVSYNFDFDTPLEDGQFIALDSLNSENNDKPYIVIEGVLDSLKKIGDKPVTYKTKGILFKVYTDKGIYFVRLRSDDFKDYTEYPESLGCYFISICDLDEILERRNKNKVKKNKENPNNTQESLIEFDSYLFWFHIHKEQGIIPSSSNDEDDDKFYRYQLYNINERCCEHLIHVDFD